MNIETLILLLFFILLFAVCISSLLIRAEIFDLEEKIEDLEDEIRSRIMETKEQKIERLKKEIKEQERYLKETPYLNETIKFIVSFQKNRLEQELKELEDDTKKSR